MVKPRKFLIVMDHVTYFFEMVIAISLLIVIAIKIVEVSSEMIGFKINILAMEFNRILSVVLTLVIGVEFIRMLCKHTPETVIDVLLFAIARQMVLYQDTTFDLLIGVVSIVALFAARKFLIDRKNIQHTHSSGADN